MGASRGQAASGGQPGGNWKPGIHWRRSEIINNTLYCTKPGRDCISFSLLRAKRLTPFHDARLADCTQAINRLLDQIAAENSDPARCLKLLLTPFGRLLVWARCEGEEGARATGITMESDPEVFHRELGLQPSVLRPEPRRDWEVDEEGYLIRCKRGANTQGVAELVAPGTLTGFHDSRLAEATRRVNALLARCKRENPRPDLDLAFLVTPRGLFLAWTKNDDSDDPTPPGAITAASEEAAIDQALGLAGASGGVPWPPLIAMAAVVAVVAIVLIALMAGGVFSGDGGTPTPAASPTPTVRTASPTVAPTPRPSTSAPTATPTPTAALTETAAPTAAPTDSPPPTDAPTPTPGRTEPPPTTPVLTATPQPTIAPQP